MRSGDKQLDHPARYGAKGRFLLPTECRRESIASHPADKKLNVDLDTLINRLETVNANLKGAPRRRIV